MKNPQPFLNFQIVCAFRVRRAAGATVATAFATIPCMPAENPSRPLIWDAGRLNDPHGQADKATRVRAMFDAIAPTYERVNRVLSLGRDAYWRREAVRLANVRGDDRVLDIACGTGDFARAFNQANPAGTIGMDFAANMLERAAAGTQSSIRWCQSDAQALPFADASFTITSCAFGVRNFQDLDRGLREMRRVLAPGGRAVILEFGIPRTPILGSLYGIYMRRALPRLARWISRDTTGAYDYLPQSVSSFVNTPEMIDRLRRAGFERVEHKPLTFGAVVVYRAWRGQ